MKTSRTCLLIAMTVALLGLSDSTVTKPIVISDAVAAISTNPLHAARLRKLHLVRPDLINYPLSFDVVC